MAGKQKGSPKTGGRTKGSLNKETLQIKEILDANVDFGKVADKLFQLSQGVQIQKIFYGMPVVYSQPPDAFAGKTLIEFRFGKAKQFTELSGSVASEPPPDLSKFTDEELKTWLRLNEKVC